MRQLALLERLLNTVATNLQSLLAMLWVGLKMLLRLLGEVQRLVDLAQRLALKVLVVAKVPLLN